MARGRYPSGHEPQRRNATLKMVPLPPLAKGEVDAPELPPREDGKAWHEMTVWWWRDVWTSPMAREYTEPDIHGLYRLAVLIDSFWKATATTARLAVSAEIRLSSTLFGLTPLDRSRLRWEVNKGEEAEKRTKERREARKAAEAAAEAAGAVDPRRAYAD